MEQHQRKAVRLVFAALVMMLAAACDPEAVDVCFDIDGEEVCGSEGAESSFLIGVPQDEASTYVVRFHPEDAENYHLNEVVEVEPNPAGRGSMAVIERLEPGPSSVCLKNDVVVQNIVENLETVLFPSGDCVSLGGGWEPSDDTVWTPTSGS